MWAPVVACPHVASQQLCCRCACLVCKAAWRIRAGLYIRRPQLGVMITAHHAPFSLILVSSNIPVLMHPGWTRVARPIPPLCPSWQKPDHGQQIALTACRRQPCAAEVGPHSRS